MKKILNWSVCLLMIGAVLAASCKKDEEEKKELRPYNAITAFVVKTDAVTFETVLNETNASITINVAPDRTDSLKNIAPTSIEISVGATISPAATVKQDFTKAEGVKYTVTAENGTAKVWTVKMNVSDKLSYGYREAELLWTKLSVTDEFADKNKPGIATLGKYVIVSRSLKRTDGEALKMYDGATGEKVLETLNTNGIPEGNYMLANDDAGNLIGCPLGYFLGTRNFEVFRWSTYDKAPISFITAPSPSFGRKLSAVGDVTKKAIVSTFDVNTAATSADHYVWKIEGGVAGTHEIVAGTKSGDIYQMMTPVSVDAIKPCYMVDRGASNGNPLSSLKYIADGVDKSIKGPVPESDITMATDDMFKATGFGRKILHVKAFTFNDARYIAVVSEYDILKTNFKYYLSIFDAKEKENPTSWKTFETIEFNGDFSDQNNGVNPNATAGIATSQEIQGENGLKTMNIYVLMSGSGVKCYQINNQVK